MRSSSPRFSSTALERRTDRFIFLRESFSLGAFLFGPLWMIWRRLWVVLVIYLVVLAAVEFGLRRLGIAMSSRIAVYALIQLLVGVEAASLRRWTLTRRGWRDCGIVIGDDRDLAERRFFEARSTRAQPASVYPTPVPPLAAASPRSGPDVTGLFPDPGGAGGPGGAPWGAA